MIIALRVGIRRPAAMMTEQLRERAPMMATFWRAGIPSCHIGGRGVRTMIRSVVMLNAAFALRNRVRSMQVPVIVRSKARDNG